MLMTGILGQVINRRTVTHVRMGEQPGILEGLQGPIHGGPVETRPALGAGAVVDVGRTQMLIVSRRHDLADGTSGIGDPIAPAAQSVDQFVGRDVHRDRLSAARRWPTGGATTLPVMPIALVTGANSGIGRATAIGLADDGAHVLWPAARQSEPNRSWMRSQGLAAAPSSSNSISPR